MSEADVILWGIGAPVVCSAITALVTHALTKDRDVKARKAILDRESDIRRRQFRRHLLKGRYTLERTRHDEPDLVWQRYSDIAPDLLAEAALVEGDFPAGLRELVERAGHWRHSDAEAEARAKSEDLRDVLRDSICDVYDFTMQPDGV